jgi:hypothetical protein
MYQLQPKWRWPDWRPTMKDKAPLSAEDRADAASYIADLAGSLAQIARRHRLHTLGYLLDMAKLEAESAKRSSGTGR